MTVKKDLQLTVGVLALQGGFIEHIHSLQRASTRLPEARFNFVEVRTPRELVTCDALVIPGGESTTLSLVATEEGLMEPLRDFVKQKRRPTWGTCAGLIMLSEEASATKRGGQELIGGLDVRVHRNHFGRQRESFETKLNLQFLEDPSLELDGKNFPAVFIRAPVVDRLLTSDVQDKTADGQSNGTQTEVKKNDKAQVEILAVLPGRHASNKAAAGEQLPPGETRGDGDIVALRQGNVFGLSFHPELTSDTRIHLWWLRQVVQAYRDL